MADSPKKFLFTCQPFLAHLLPHAALIKELEAKGHQVWLAAPEKLAEHAARYGINHIPAGRDWSADPAVHTGVARRLLTEGNDAFNREAFGHLARGAQYMAPDVLEIARELQPDAIITDISEFGGAFAGELLGIPVITSDNGLARLVHDLHDPVMRPILDEVRRDLGLGPAPEGLPGSFQTLITPAPKELLLPDLEIPGLVSFQHQNPLPLDARLPEGAFEGEGPKVYGMFGSTGSTVPSWRPIFEGSNRMAIEALAETGYDVLLSVGRGNVHLYADFEGTEEDLGGRAVPARGAPNVKIVAHCVQPLALEEADVALLHGGFGGLREALAGGTPALYMPNQTDQPDNARLLAANGLGLNLDPKTATPADVRAGVEELFDRFPEFADQLRDFQERTAALPDLPTLAEGMTRALEVGDLTFTTLKHPAEEGPGGGGEGPQETRPTGPVAITGVAAPEIVAEPEIGEELGEALEAPEVAEPEAPAVAEPEAPAVEEPEVVQVPEAPDALVDTVEFDVDDDLFDF